MFPHDTRGGRRSGLGAGGGGCIVHHLAAVHLDLRCGFTAARPWQCGKLGGTVLLGAGVCLEWKGGVMRGVCGHADHGQ